MAKVSRIKDKSTVFEMIGEYEIVDGCKIGRGSFGHIYAVTHPHNKDEILALKKINLRRCNEKDRRHCLDEVKQLQSCDHLNIVKYVDSFRDGYVLCIVMEYCKGGNLRQYIQKHGRIRENQFLKLFTQICEGIRYLHKRGIAHRDVKTTNILLSENHQVVKIADLGLAKPLETVCEATRAVGSPYFMSPEMINGKPYTLKTDIWSLGCCMYEMGTGDILYKADSTDALAELINDSRKTEKLSKQLPYCEALVCCLKIMLFGEPECRPDIDRVLFSLKLDFHKHETEPQKDSARIMKKKMERRKHVTDEKVDSGYNESTAASLLQEENQSERPRIKEQSFADITEESDPHRSEKGTQTSGVVHTQAIHSGLDSVGTELDVNKWEKVLEAGSDSGVMDLLDKGILPGSSSMVNKICIKWQKKSVIVRRVCSEICKWIKDKYDFEKKGEHMMNVLPVYGSSRQGHEHIFFLVIMSDSEVEKNIKEWNLEYDVIFKMQGVYSGEGEYVRKQEQDLELEFTENDMNKLTHCFRKHNVTLMKSHSNLQMISASLLKSRKYGQSSRTLRKCLCIVFYVTKKGYVPLQEKVLPTRLDDIKTDVREGGFEFCTGANEWHNRLKMGCQISGDRIAHYGTLGAFLKRGTDMYCLTCAHVVVGELRANSSYHRWCHGEINVNMYQPKRDPTSYFLAQPFGDVCSMIFKSGDSLTSGMEVAVIRIINRHPDSGTFPDSASTNVRLKATSSDGSASHIPQGCTMMYNTGIICEKEFFEQNNGVEVIKFGCETGETRGIFRLHGTAVRKQYLAQDNGSILLFNQIEISNSIDGIEFAKHGDSGALILVPYAGNRNDLRAVAILEGRSSDGTILATPICDILDELEVTDRKLMQFNIPGVYHSVSVDSGTTSPNTPMASGSQGDDFQYAMAQADGGQESEVDFKIRELKETYLIPTFNKVDESLKANKAEIASMKTGINRLVSMVQHLVEKTDNDINQRSSSAMHIEDHGNIQN